MHVKYPQAVVALEVMVVLMRSRLIARAFAGKVDGTDLACIQQKLDVAIDRCQRKRRYFCLCRFENFLR